MPDAPARFLVVLDADSTLIRNEVIELIADEAGRGPEVAAATEAAMRGEVDFATSLRSRVRELARVPVASFARVLSRIEPTPGVRELIDAVHARASSLDALSDEMVHGLKGGDISVKPWGERSFYVNDPWGNQFCFVEAGTVYAG